VKTNYVLIDYENVQVQSLALLKDGQFQVRVFLGPNNTKLPVELVMAMQELGSRGEYIVLETPGSNALDFHIAYYLGVLTAADPAGFFHIISKDTGFDPLMQHLRRRKISVARSEAMEEMPCFKKPAPPLQEKHVKPKKSTEELFKLVVEDLHRRKNSKPRSAKTLRSTIHARCGKDLPNAEIDAVWQALLKQGYIKINGEKVSYTPALA
jgi:hypothetical protein